MLLLLLILVVPAGYVLVIASIGRIGTMHGWQPQFLGPRGQPPAGVRPTDWAGVEQFSMVGAAAGLEQLLPRLGSAGLHAGRGKASSSGPSVIRRAGGADRGRPSAATSLPTSQGCPSLSSHPSPSPASPSSPPLFIHFASHPAACGAQPDAAGA